MPWGIVNKKILFLFTHQAFCHIIRKESRFHVAEQSSLLATMELSYSEIMRGPGKCCDDAAFG
ncbi:MAG: hypothetical protein WED04_11010 [Promethearchaeati archaeon SRVP18_Atabeyarchaeia-1]